MLPGPKPRDGVWDRTPIEPGGRWLSLAFHSPVHSPADTAGLLICPPSPTPTYLSRGKVTRERDVRAEGESRGSSHCWCGQSVCLPWATGMPWKAGKLRTSHLASIPLKRDAGCQEFPAPRGMRWEQAARPLSGNRVVGRSQERPEQLLRGPMPEATAGEVLREASVWYKWGIYEETPILRGEGGPGGAGQG